MESDLALRRHSRRVYEAGRVLRALFRGAAVAPMLLVASASPHPSAALWPAALLLFAMVLVFSIRGGSAGRAVPAALLSGLAPLLLPVAVRATGHATASSICMSLCLPACYAGGAIAGASLVILSRAEEDGDRRKFMVAALLMSAAAGALGCSVVGAGGVLGMLAAELLVSAPVWRAAH